jgi:3-dehydroquinate dehydratase
MKFTDTIKELEAKARADCFYGGVSAVRLQSILYNHAKEIINLVEAAEEVVTAETDPDGYVAKIALRDALAALNKEQS